METQVTKKAAEAIGQRYVAAVELSPYYGRVIFLTGKRGARYRSIPAKTDGLHRFIDRPVGDVVLAISDDGTVCLPEEL